MNTTNSLQHHGILGMKWGVRRYQNYDGSYTQEGMRRYNKSLDEYEAAKKKTKVARESGDRRAIRQAKADERTKRRELNRNYDQLKRDKLADQGKELHQQGKTIRGNNLGRDRVTYGAAVVSLGASLLTRELARDGHIRAAAGSALVANGSALVAGILWRKSKRETKQLRAYYYHDQWRKANG